MKKIFTVAVMLLAGFTAFAQLNIGAGYQNEMWSAKNGDTKSNVSLNGVYAGASYNIPLNFVDGLGIAPGAYFTWAMGQDSDPLLGTLTINDMSIVVPVHITFGMDLGSTSRLFAYLGPAFQYGLSYKGDYENAGIKVKGDNSYTQDSGISPFDVKLDLGFGFKYKFIQANVGFDFGFLDRDKNKNDNYKLHEQLIHAGIAFSF